MNQTEINISLKRSFINSVDKSLLRIVALQVLTLEGIGPSTEMGLLITDDRTVQRLNRIYRGENKSTDVLSFQTISDVPEDQELLFVDAPDGIKHLGEVVISYTQAMKQAQERGHSIVRELTLLIIHGTLHLLGYDHELPEDEHRMRDRENQILLLVEAV
jgi:probable rRNA maturation factor